VTERPTRDFRGHPPWTLNELVVDAALPGPPAVKAALPPSLVIAVEWPRCRVTGAAPPPPPRVIRLAARPQGPWRLTFPQGHPLRNPDLYARM
jgi:hypothetical protein